MNIFNYFLKKRRYKKTITYNEFILDKVLMKWCDGYRERDSNTTKFKLLQNEFERYQMSQFNRPKMDLHKSLTEYVRKTLALH